MARTPYTETECLLAVMEDDSERATELASGMTRGEQAEFLSHLRRTMQIVEDAEPTIL